jgi:signal transduction histidine kinase
MAPNPGRSTAAPREVVETLRRVTSGLVGADDAAETERRTCTRLASAAPYRSAWIGRREADAEEVVVRATPEGTTAEGAAADAEAVGPLLRRAHRTGEVAVAVGTPDSAAGAAPASPSTTDSNSNSDFGSGDGPERTPVAVVPLVQEGTDYGALVLAAAPDRPDAFGADERALLADLGRDLARALTDLAARERLREEADLLDAVFEHAPVHLYVKDASARTVRTSAYYIDDPESQVGKTDLELYEPGLAEQSYADDLRVIETGEPIRNRIEYAPVQDEWNRTCKVPWRGEDGEVRGLIGATWHVTERKRYERELERQNERLESVAGALGHDLRNPLAVASAVVESLREEAADPGAAASDPGTAEIRDRLSTAADALSRMDTLIEDVLALAREGRAVADADRERLSLERAAAEAWGMTDTRGAACRFADGLSHAEADPGRLHRLFANLFRNSVEHGSTGSRAAPGDSVEHGSTGNRSETNDSVEHGSASSERDPDGGPEHRSASSRPRVDGGEPDESPSPTVAVGPLEGEAGFYVADDGVGFPDGERERVFDREFSTGGTGLGLAIVETIAEAHGWSATATESADGGARVEVRTDPTDPELVEPPAGGEPVRSSLRDR